MKTCHLSSIYQLTPHMLKIVDVDCLFLDIDNTIRKYSETEPSKRTAELVKKLQNGGIKIILCSNNLKSRVKPFADKLACDFVAFSLKPSPLGMLRAWRKSGVSHKKIMVIGDQVFNDILAGKLIGLKTLLVLPIDSQNEPSTVTARRIIFKPFENKIFKNRNPFLEG